jgi:putative SOS response-associated peptidase YedK
VTSFCEPNADVKPATWNWFALTGDEPRPLFAFAGIWKRHVGPIKKDGEPVDIHVFSFMTTTPNELVATVNHERMPVLLATPEAQDTWMQGTDAQAFELCRPYPSERMALVQTSYEKRDLLTVGAA